MVFSPWCARSVLLRIVFIVLSWVLAAGNTVSAGEVTFAERIDVPTGTFPLGMAIADLDGDGLRDVVTSVHEEDVIAVFRQTRGGQGVQFAEAVEIAAGLHPQEVLVADFDGDGKPDIAVGDSGRAGGGTLSVFRNTSTPGTISFEPRVAHTADTARRIAMGDLDRDGKVDIVVSSNSAKEFLIFQNASEVGTLSFSRVAALPVVNFPSSLELADLDQDGLLDLVGAIHEAGVVSVYPNVTSDGAISFGSRLDFPAGDVPDGPGVGQFDGEGGLDVVVTNVFSDKVLLLLNRSTPGTFAFDAPLEFPAGSEPREPEVADLDGDGLPEVTVQNIDERVVVLTTVIEDGIVSLEVAADAVVGPEPILADLGDLDGDGATDFVSGNKGDYVAIFLNRTEGAATAPNHLLLCEVAVSPTAGEFMEIVNPTTETVSLEDVYLADTAEYALLAGADPVAGGPAPSVSRFDFIVRFPSESSIEPGGVVVVAMDGAGFLGKYKFPADYEIKGTDDPGTPDMDPVDRGSSAGFTDSGEHAVLFRWDGTSDLVEDLDMVRVGRPTIGGSNDIANKTGVVVDGPDGDTDQSPYLADAFTMGVASSDPGSGESVKRVLTEGPSELDADGNGLTGHDETSEDIVVTWDSEFEYIPADPGVCCLTLPCYYASADLSDGTALRNSLHQIIDDHLRWSYSNIWEILEFADEDPLNPTQIVDLYKNAPYPKDRVSYEREHSWPKSYGFPIDLVSNYPYTDAYHLFLADGTYNNMRSDKPYRFCDDGCDEYVTLDYDGRGGGSGTYPGFSNWTQPGTWETWLGRRGDVARALFYLDIRYEGGLHGVTGYAEPDLRLTDNDALIAQYQTGSNEPTAYMGILSNLLQWHEEDPVDFREEWRNNVIVRYQRNRNPFIDHPEWVACLYDNVCPGVDLTVSKDDGWPDAVAGETVTYTIEVGNIGPDDVTGASVTDMFDPTRFDVDAITWTCTPTAGAGPATTCPASGDAADLETGVVVDIETGDAVVFTVDSPVLASASGTLVNTATADAPTGIFERDEASNSDTDSNDLPALGTCGHPDERVLTATTVTTTELAQACTQITAGSGFRVEDPGDVTLRAGQRIVLTDGFSVEGGKFVVEIDPALKP